MKHASIIPNTVPARFDGEALIVPCPAGWDDVSKICDRVLEFEGRTFTFTGWNSDRNVAFFKPDDRFARVLGEDSFRDADRLAFGKPLPN